MHRFIDGEDRTQQALLPHSLEDYVDGENPVRVIEVFIDELDLAAMGFSGVTPAATGRPAYHPSTLLKIYLYGYRRSASGSAAPDRSMAAPSRCRTAPIPAAAHRVRRTDRSTAASASPAHVVRARTRKTAHPAG